MNYNNDHHNDITYLVYPYSKSLDLIMHITPVQPIKG